MSKRINIFFCFTIAFAPFCHAQVSKTPAQLFPLADVQLLDSPFKRAQETDLQYIMSLNPDRLLAPFLREAGLTPKAPSYGNWEKIGLDGHIGGHYLSALANMYAATGDEKVKQRLNYMLSELKRCQDANGNGYVAGIPGGKTMWADIAQGKIKATTGALNDKWVPLYNIHKLFAGLYDAYTIAGNVEAKAMLIKLTDWFLNLTKNLSDEQAQTMLRSENGGLNEAFANVYDITNDTKYLNLARKFSHMAILTPLLTNEDKLTGLHANTQIPKAIGFERIAQLAHDSAWDNAARFFWKTVVEHRTIAIGGNSVREHFNPVDNFTSMIEAREGPETCNSYNMLKLTKELYLQHPSSAYIDYYERTLYNHILSSQRPEGGFVYFTPIRPGHYRVYSSAQESFWCCVGTGMENHGKYGEMIYAHTDTDLTVNLYIASKLTWKDRGLTLLQQTQFPYAQTSKLTLKLNKDSRFTVKLRYPVWVEKAKMAISINGEAQSLLPDSQGYVSVSRLWKPADVITVTLPMHNSAEFLPDGSGWVAFLHGPIVLAADMGPADQPDLTATGNTSPMGHTAAGPLYPLDDAPMLVWPGKDVASGLTDNGKALSFSASKLIYQDKYRDLKLVPFYTLQNTRYTIYWPYTNSRDLPKVLASIKVKELAKQQLDAQTIDLVQTGEQQPEKDHAFKGDKTIEGIFAERHFRGGAGWFSYIMNNLQGNNRILRLTYHGLDHNRSFDVFINGVLLSHVTLDGKGGNKFIDVSYPLAADIVQTPTIEVKFVASAGSAIANIYEVRLMK